MIIAYRYIVVIFTLMSFLLPISVSAQSYWNATDSIFGSNPLLYNGKLYSANVPINTSGDPFFAGKEFMKGQVTLKDKIYTDLDLNYDIYNQLLLLKFTNINGSTYIVDLSKSWLEGFQIGSYVFEFMPTINSKGSIYQVIKCDSVKILYAWRKDFKLTNSFGSTEFSYSIPRIMRYVQINQKILFYSNNKEFIKAFPNEVQKKLAVYMRLNRVKIRKISDDKMLRLLQNFNTLYIK